MKRISGLRRRVTGARSGTICYRRILGKGTLPIKQRWLSMIMALTLGMDGLMGFGILASIGEDAQGYAHLVTSREDIMSWALSLCEHKRHRPEH